MSATTKRLSNQARKYERVTSMEGLNRVTIVGNCGQDPEIRFTQNNQAVLTLRLACSESWFDKRANERKERTEWVTVVIWGPRAESLNKILSKGSRILVEGRLQTCSWEDKNGGGKRYATEVVSNNVILLGGKPANGSKQDAAAGGDGGSVSGSYESTIGEYDDSEIPF